MAEDVEVIIPDIHAAHADGAGLGVVQAGDELHQTGLCAAGAADDAQCLAGLDVKGDVVQDRLAGAVLVLEGDVVEADAAVLDFLHGSLAGGRSVFSSRTSTIRFAEAADMEIMTKAMLSIIRPSGCS